MKTLNSKTNDLDLKKIIQQLCNKVIKECRVTKDLYYNTLVLENLDNQDRLWKAGSGKVLPQASTATETFCRVEDGVVHDTNIMFANYFNRFFSTVGAK